MSFNPMGSFTYSIQYGDTLWLLANRFNVSVDSILTFNPGIDPNNLMIGQLINIPLANEINNLEDEEEIYTQLELDLSNRIRELWEQHIAWTRMAIIDLVYNLPELDHALTRLLLNPVHFAELLRPFYGDDAADRFKFLLTDHLTIAAEIVKAAQVNDSQKVEEEQRKWHENADDIARLLADINPFWSEEAWKKMFYMHLDLVTQEALNFLGSAFEKNTTLYDEMERQAMEMADAMFFGIIAQFSDCFD